jgi:hypothetical protein
MGRIGNWARLARACGLALGLSGCAHNVVPMFSAEPYKADSQNSMVFGSAEMNQIGAVGLANAPANDATSRNTLITTKMYLIDQAYFDYETRLTHDDEFVSALGSLATFSTTTVAAVIPVGQATKVLSAVASGFSGGVNLYDQKVLLSQTMQALQNQMRADRDNQAAVLYARMACSSATYPQGLAYSDLEAYARAGTLSSALLGLNKTTTQAQTQAAAAKDTASQTNPSTISGVGKGQDLATQLTRAASKIAQTASCPITPPPS